MKRTLLLFLLLQASVLIPGAALAQEECAGTTEQMLQCYSPEVKEFLRTWVQAWGEGDIETYLSLYNSLRSPRDDMSRDRWEAHRRARISPGREIEINLKLESMGLEDSGIFDVVFKQQYLSPSFQDEVRKRLFLIREAGQLRIWKEEVL